MKSGTKLRPKKAPETPAAGSAGTSAVIPPRGLGARRRRPVLIIASIVLIVVSATGGAALFTARDHREKVLVVAQPVAYGEVLEAGDLREVRWTKTTGIAAVPAAEKASLVGKRAAVDLFPDMLITRAQVTDRPLLQPGQVTVVVALAPEQMPVRALAPGQRVQMVSTPGKNADQVQEKDAKPLPSPIEAVVVEVGKRDERSGKTTVEVAVSAVDGPALAQRVYTERIAVVVFPPGGTR